MWKSISTICLKTTNCQWASTPEWTEAATVVGPEMEQSICYRWGTVLEQTLKLCQRECSITKPAECVGIFGVITSAFCPVISRHCFFFFFKWLLQFSHRRLHADRGGEPAYMLGSFMAKKVRLTVNHKKRWHIFHSFARTLNWFVKPGEDAVF